MTLSSIKERVSKGESETLEFKRSTNTLTRCGETLCAFLNTNGGAVVIGVTDDGGIVGQEVSDKTRREIAATLHRFDPPAPVDVLYIDLPAGGSRKLIVLEAKTQNDVRPFTFDSRPYQRVQTTTSVMPKERYETLILDRAHVRRRWENEPAVDITLSHLDHEEILRTRDAAIRQQRISAGTSMDVGDILDRLGLRRDGVITQAAQMLYGTRFLPDYPQAKLKLARFRGTKITGEILDNKQEHLHAFAAVRESMAFLVRVLPLSAHFTEGEIFREDRLPVPPDALREILLNAVMHRDYSDPGSFTSVAIFDDRIEICSIGRLLSGVTIDGLSEEHPSKLRNPLIAETFHRTGAVEVWGRGTNRVIDECRKRGIEPPSFNEQFGALIVTFRAAISQSVAGVLGPAPVELGRRAQRILALLRERKELTSAELLTLIGDPITQRYVQKELRALQAGGFVIASGRGRGTAYRLGPMAL